MGKRIFQKDILVILIVFIASRIIIRFLDIHFSYIALYQYWQYLDVWTLRHNLLTGLWYDHAQPPFFNFLLGVVLKLFGFHAPLAFNIIFKTITLINVLLLLNILKQRLSHRYLPLIICLLYLLSPATMLLETELFYTTFISTLLLLSVYFIFRFRKNKNTLNAFFVFFPLAVLCLTRSIYHLSWLVIISFAVLIYFRNSVGFRKLVTSAVICMLLVTGWYVKNYMIFSSFSSSTWIGMNFARNVFHDNEIKDSSKIEAYEPFSKISYYNKFISGNLEKKFAGINDRDLLSVMKNDTFVNENHISYIEVSHKYIQASKTYIKAHPAAYLKNVLQSTVIFFTPATRYPLLEKKAQQIKYYDAVYSFNLSQFAQGKQQRRIALTISSLPKMMIYFMVVFVLIRSMKKNKELSFLNIFIMLIIGYVFLVSSIFEHYENMRFRYEIEPLFLILLAQVVEIFLLKKSKISSQIVSVNSDDSNV